MSIIKQYTFEQSIFYFLESSGTDTQQIILETTRNGIDAD